MGERDALISSSDRRIIDTLAGEPTLEQLDDYLTATKYLMKKALLSGDGKTLRALKTLMDAVPTEKAGQ